MKTIQLGQVEGVKDTIGLENQSSYLGYNGMGHHDNEGISGITKGKGKGKKGSGKGFGKQFQGYCNTCGMWVTQQLIARHEAKERTMQDGILAIEAKDQAKVEQRDLPKARARK